MRLPHVQVLVKCPMCGFYKSLGVVQVKDVWEAQKGEPVPFTIDYRKFIGGKGHGMTNERRAPGVVPYRLKPAWLAFVGRIKEAFDAVKKWVEESTIIPLPLMVVATPAQVVRPKGLVFKGREVIGGW